MDSQTLRSPADGTITQAMGATVRRQLTASTTPITANPVATRNAVRQPGPSTSTPESAAPPAIPPTNAVIGQV